VKRRKSKGKQTRCDWRSTSVLFLSWLVWGICGSGFEEAMQLAAGGVEGALLLV
jgi:hypothetical protein